MPTQITGPVRLPDGSELLHGRVIFTPKAPILAENVVLSGAVIAPIVSGQIDITLEAVSTGTPYSVLAEHWSDLTGLVRTALPDVIPDGSAGPFSIIDLAATRIPAGATNETSFKRGDTISLGGKWIDSFGRSIDLTGYLVSAAMRGPDGLIRSMLVSAPSLTEGEIELTMAADESTDLPIGRHQVDVKIQLGVRVMRTQTGFINILQEVTP